MSIIESIRESVSIPLFYYPVFKDGEFFVDGGLSNNYPIEILYNYLPKEQVFGIKLLTNGIVTSAELPTSLSEYITKIIVLLHNQANKIHVNENDWERTIKVNTGTISTTDFKLTDEQKLWLINQGIIAAKKFFDKY
jgi:NTE family protein